MPNINKSNNNETIKLCNTAGKYITAINSDNGQSFAKIKSKLHNSNQAVSYNTQGELIVDDKCLTYRDAMAPVYFDSCSSSNSKQKWRISRGKINTADDDLCLTSSIEENNTDENIYVTGCDNLDQQTWDTENSDSDGPNDYRWNKFKGKTVVLVQSDNPWYINKDITIPEKWIDGFKLSTDMGDRLDLTYAQRAEMQSRGYDTSFAGRAGIEQHIIEGFDGSQYDQITATQLLAVIIIIIVILVSCKWMRN